MYNTLKSSFIKENNKLIKKYYFNDKEITKKELLEHIKNIVSMNNEVFYKQLKDNKFNYSMVDNILMDYKQVKSDILNNGLIYQFKISLED